MVRLSVQRPLVLAAVVNYDRADLTERTVADLNAQSRSADMHVIAIDSGSSPEGRAEFERTLGPIAELVQLNVNAGYGAACNTAAGMASREGIPYLWLLNNDLWVPPDTLERLLDALTADPNLAAVAAVTVDPTGRRILGAGVEVRMRRGIVRHLFQGARPEELPDAPFEVDALEGACMLVRVSAFREVGGFDERYFMYWEDADWSVRTRGAAYGLQVVPGARVRHFVASSSSQVLRTRLMLRNRVRFVRSCGSRLDQVTFLVSFAVIWLPAYTVARLVPRFGLVQGIRIAFESVAWNLRDAAAHGGWRIGPRGPVSD